MEDKSFIELSGQSNQGINEALSDALTSNNGTINWYEIIETNSSTEEHRKHYQVKIKACLEAS